MSQQWVFTFVPYLAVGLGLAGVLWRLASAGDPAVSSAAGRTTARLLGRSRAWMTGIAGVLAGHVAALLVPRWILVWNQHSLRLLVLELTGVAFACLALAGLAGNLRAWLRDARPISRLDAVAATLITAVLVSGLGTAILYRWGSSWATVTVVPYLYSVLRLDPEPQWMASLPYLVRLHALSFFALVAIWPFTSFGAVLARRPSMLARGGERCTEPS